MRPETSGSRIITPAPIFLHVPFGFRVIWVTRHKLNLGWISVESTWSPFRISSPDLYFKTKRCMAFTRVAYMRVLEATFPVYTALIGT